MLSKKDIRYRREICCRHAFPSVTHKDIRD